MTVSMPTHPYFGMCLKFVKRTKDQQGRRYIFVLDPRSCLLRLPIEWTEFAPSKTPLSKNGYDLEINLDSLARLSRAVKAALLVNLDISASEMKMGSAVHQRMEHAHGCNGDIVVESFRQRKKQIDRCLGDPDTQITSKLQSGGDE